jgi:hypothetical protein
LFALGAVALGSVVVLRSLRHSTPAEGRALAYRVEGGELGDGGYLRSSGATGAALHFAEGTEIRLTPGARGRLGKVDGHGARFAIEQGEAEVNVTPRPEARWLIDAGPFLIAVRGTTFKASWNGATERLDVDMKKGLVAVTGPVAEGAVAVRGGQHLTVNVQTKEVLLRQNGTSGGLGESAAPAPAEAPAAAAPEGKHAGASAPATRATADRTSRVAPRNWVAALGTGDFEGILQDAEQRGLKASLTESSAADLAALGDAARYRRRDDIARQALLAERARFPQSARARDAAFLLGRLEDGAPGGGARALEWYDRYLEEAPLGAYASEALGRKMTATAKVQGPAAARKIAAVYLQRFPTGTYATTARAFLEAFLDPSLAPSLDAR